VLAQDQGLAALLFQAETGFEQLETFEQWRVFKYLHGFMTMSEQDFLVARALAEGTMGGGFVYDWKNFMKQQHFLAYWEIHEERFGNEFRAFVNELATH